MLQSGGQFDLTCTMHIGSNPFTNRLGMIGSCGDGHGGQKDYQIELSKLYCLVSLENTANLKDDYISNTNGRLTCP